MCLYSCHSNHITLSDIFPFRFTQSSHFAQLHFLSACFCNQHPVNLLLHGFLCMAALNILPVNFVPLTTSVKVLFSTSSCIFSPPFHEVCRESLFLLRRNHQPPQKITLHTALLSVTGQNGHSADCPDVPLRGSKS